MKPIIWQTMTGFHTVQCTAIATAITYAYATATIDGMPNYCFAGWLEEFNQQLL